MYQRATTRSKTAAASAMSAFLRLRV
jgi:hypothetical protein